MAESKIHKQDNNKQKIINKPTETEKFEKFEKVKCQPCFLSLSSKIFEHKTSKQLASLNTAILLQCTCVTRLFTRQLGWSGVECKGRLLHRGLIR